MKFIKNIFDRIFKSPSEWDKMSKESYDLGKEIGAEEERKNNLAIRFYETKGLTDKEKQELLKFLIDRNLELCYDIRNGGNGFSVRKRIYDKVLYYEEPKFKN